MTRHRLTLLMLLVGAGTLLAQPTVVFHRSYADLPFPLRIENSGIYGVEAFALEGEIVRLSSYDKPEIAVFNMRDHSMSTQPRNDTEHPLVSKHERIRIALSGPHTIAVSIPSGVPSGTLTITRTEELAYADLLGVDQHETMFLLVESYRSQIPLRVKREVLALAPDGTQLTSFEIPIVNYCTTTKDLEVDAEGNVYQLLSDQTGITIVRWPPTGGKLSELPPELRAPIHYNDCVPTTEAPGTLQKDAMVVSSRAQALRIAESYVLHQYVCSPGNLSPVDIVAPDGDVVRTPSWLMAGVNVRLPYKWGGFNTLAQFDAGIAAGKFAGDINTSGSSSSAVGVDCSGFVSRCWQLGYHSSTADMPGITVPYASWIDLKPGDAIHKVGHVRLFVERMPNGAIRVAESAGRDWSVNYWTYLPSDLAAYTPRFYTGMGEDYCSSRPTLMSVVPGTPGNVRIAWSCDTAGVVGYRLYASGTGATWAALGDVSVAAGTSYEVPAISSARFFRIAAIGATAMPGESQWSNALGASAMPGTRNALIVDGYERDNGSWRGPGDLFSIRYGLAIAASGVAFHSCRSQEVAAGRIRLPDYSEVYWLLGDESTVNESFSSAEQTLVQEYLESGGRLFVSGSEIGYDLVEKGSPADRVFYSTYLKAQYLSDNAGSKGVVGQTGGVFEGIALAIGQAYDEDYPDEIEASGGALTCMRYANGKGAAIQYAGIFGSGLTPGKLVYLGFPLETTASDTSLACVVRNAEVFFGSGVTSVGGDLGRPAAFGLDQNFPNPFNPSTTIGYTIAGTGHEAIGNRRVKLAVYDILGREVAVLVDEEKRSGSHTATWNADRMASGVYFCRLSARGEAGGQSVETRAMILER